MPVRSLTEALPATWTRGEIAVVGLARSGRAAAELLARAGASVYASDAGSGDAVQHAARVLEPLGVAVQLGGHDLARIAASAVVVASPGVPPDAPPLAAARAAGRRIVSELEIALEFLPHQRYVAITGTNGKTTTTAITHRLLEGLGYDTVAAGNIGTPLAEVALRGRAPDWIALETSSFQLHDTPSIAPAAGVLTNLSANHLDRYASVAEYFGDKELLFRNAGARSGWDGRRAAELPRARAPHRARWDLCGRRMDQRLQVHQRRQHAGRAARHAAADRPAARRTPQGRAVLRTRRRAPSHRSRGDRVR